MPVTCFSATPRGWVWIAALLRRYLYDFIALFASHLTWRVVDRARAAASQSEVDTQFKDV